jgi:hypothetical protein
VPTEMRIIAIRFALTRLRVSVTLFSSRIP